MTEQIDFLKLYQELGLTATCSLAELKHAYRRRIATLHPDRNPGHAPTPHAQERLQQLTVLYGAAIDFHRRFQRLPGASGATPAPPSRLRDRTTAPGSAWRESSVAARGSGDYSRLIIVAILLAALGWAIWEVASEEENRSAGSTSSAPAAARPTRGRAAATELVPGMDVASVRAIEGEPVFIASPDRWEYGPSYVAFQKGKLIDWYSSPLRPLKVATPRPPPIRSDHGQTGGGRNT